MQDDHIQLAQDTLIHSNLDSPEPPNPAELLSPRVVTPESDDAIRATPLKSHIQTFALSVVQLLLLGFGVAIGYGLIGGIFSAATGLAWLCWQLLPYAMLLYVAAHFPSMKGALIAVLGATTLVVGLGAVAYCWALEAIVDHAMILTNPKVRSCGPPFEFIAGFWLSFLPVVQLSIVGCLSMCGTAWRNRASSSFTSSHPSSM